MNFLRKKDKKNLNNKGFTLIETFVAVTVLTIAMMGPFTLVMKSLAISKATKGQITAMYLAQEAIEFVRNIRDENILVGNRLFRLFLQCETRFLPIHHKYMMASMFDTRLSLEKSRKIR